MEPAVLTVRIGACLLLAGLLAGCGLGRSAPKPAPSAPGIRLELPAGFLGTTAWLPDGYVYVVRSPDPGAPDEVWRVAPGRPAEQLAMPNLAGCQRTNWLMLYAVPDGRLGLARYCIMDDPKRSHIDAVAFDPRTRQIQVLAPLGEYAPTAVSWRKDLHTGYVSYGDGKCAGFAALSQQGVTRLPEPITIDGRTWAVDQVFFTPATADCSQQGRADQALLTPDEHRMVFLASPESQGRTGDARERSPWHVYLQDLPDGRPRAVVRGFSDWRGMALAPDGRHLAVPGDRGGEHGLWMIDLDAGNMRKLTGVVLNNPSFAPDGRRLAVIHRLDDDHAELRVLDVAG
jgi:hypothetical protein